MDEESLRDSTYRHHSYLMSDIELARLRNKENYLDELVGTVFELIGTGTGVFGGIVLAYSFPTSHTSSLIAHGALGIVFGSYLGFKCREAFTGKIVEVLRKIDSEKLERFIEDTTSLELLSSPTRWRQVSRFEG